MHLLACSVFVLLLVQISVSQRNCVDNTMAEFTDKASSFSCPPFYGCKKAYYKHEVHVDKCLFPKCTVNVGGCRKKKCGKHKQPKKSCQKTCYPKLVWKEKKCCHTYWVLQTKKCKCSKYPFKIPRKPKRVSTENSLEDDNATNKTLVDTTERYCPPLYNCEGALVSNTVQVAPDLFPNCVYKQRYCRKQRCGRGSIKPRTKPCQKTCYPMMVWEKIKCCRTYWVLKTKKCKCRWNPFPIPPRPVKVADSTIGA